MTASILLATVMMTGQYDPKIVERFTLTGFLSYESPTSTSAETQNFPLSKARLNKGNIVYSDGYVLCLRLKEKKVWLSAV